VLGWSQFTQCPMQILHYEKNFRYSDRQFLAVARKLGKLATFCTRVQDESSFIRIDVECRLTEKRQDQLKVSITLELPEKWLRAVSRRPDVVEAVDRCVEKLEPQVKKYKELRSRRVRARS